MHDAPAKRTPTLLALAALSVTATRAGAADSIAPLADRLWLFSGKLHPVIVHFPIALLIAAAFLECIRFRRGARTPSTPALACTILGAAGAIAAAALGWSDAITSGHSGTDASTLFAHRWLGIAVAGVALIAALLAPLARARDTHYPFAWYRFFLVLAAISVAITGHLGGTLVYGQDYTERALAQLFPSMAAPPVTLVSGSAKIDFERDVRPIFARRCYQCHAGSKPESGFSLETRAAALQGGKSGKPALVAGKSADSYLIAMISGQVPGKQMPPKGGALDAESIKTLRAWIDQGAVFSDSKPGEHWHWAYRPPVRISPPAVNDTYWPRNPIDNFVLARLESEGVKPSPQADRETLIRRVSLDLIGLPPSVKDVDEFLADRRPDAYERLVDRLLASPHYGERFARPWLDLARYGDTNGYEKDNRRVAWPFRDWVIDALNRDEPFDQFTIDQLAGDLVPNPTREQLIATGFHRNTMVNEEGGVDLEEFRAETIIDRVNTTASTWLGSTIACAQCHDHKFDPLKQTDYYRLFAIFNNCETDARPNQFDSSAAGAMIPVPRKGREAEYDKTVAELAAAEAKLNASTPAFNAAFAEWQRAVSDARDAWRVLPVKSGKALSGAALTPAPDASVVVSGDNPEKDTYDLTLDADLAGAAWLRLELMVDDGTKGIGRNPDDTNIVLSEFSLTRTPVAAPRADAAKLEAIAFSDAIADFEQAGAGPWPARGAIDGDPKTGWAVAPTSERPHAIFFQFAKPVDPAPGAVYTVTLANLYGGHLNPAHFRLSAATTPPPRESISVPLHIADLLAKPAVSRTAEQSRELADYYRSVTPLLADTRAQVAALTKQRDDLIAAHAMVLKELDTPRETHVFIRGSFLSPGDRVEPGTPMVLPQLPKAAPGNRLTFARWLVDGKNPLTSRVAVNRMWETHFGKGLVETSEDFGTQGDPPTHPELLDWLATEFVRQGWSMKAMHRLIVTSATYMQSSRITPEQLQRDPADKLLARAPRFRIEAEMIRDVALEASGLLSTKLGGPSVFPPQPEGTWTMIYNSDQWIESKGEDKYRRGIYTFSRRTAPYPLFVMFDAPSHELTCTRRPRTNTPLQALATLNDPQFVEAAGALARRMVAEAGPDLADRLTLGFRLCTARRPSPAELERLAALYHQSLDYYSATPTDAATLAAVGATGTGLAYDAPEIASMTVVANVLLNLDETLTRE